MTSILNTVKKAIGPSVSEYEYFDSDLIMHINTTFNVLKQLGVGPAGGFYIEDAEADWDEFIDPGPNSQMVQTYMCLAVRLKFDPPESSAHMQAIKDQMAELEWRLNIDAETPSFGGKRPSGL